MMSHRRSALALMAIKHTDSQDSEYDDLEDEIRRAASKVRMRHTLFYPLHSSESVSPEVVDSFIKP